MRDGYVLALDQGTSSSRAVLVDGSGRVVAAGQRRLSSRYPRPGWVEQDAEAIWQSQWGAVQDCLASARMAASEIRAIGVANQRETTVVWDRRTGKALYPAIVWQCRRSAGVCAALKREGAEPLIRAKTGLVIDPYFSATKLRWLFDEHPDLARGAQAGEVCFGTVDSWIVHRLSGGSRHVTDPSNAARTLLYNIHTGAWDPELLALFHVPASMCPEVVDSVGVVAEADARWFGRALPVAGIAGDQQAALFGQACFDAGMVKNTYGTGAFLLMNTGSRTVASSHGLLTTVAWRINGESTYALEGSVFIAGAVVRWLQDPLGLVSSPEETEALARSVEDTGGVYFVPAFTGLGAPYWDPDARGTLVGLTLGSGRAEIVRAALESIAYQTRDVVDAMSGDTEQPVTAVRVDGGAIANNFLAQYQADILGHPVERARMTETTALGAAFMAGLGSGLWSGTEDIRRLWQADARFVPHLEPDERERRYRGWQDAVRRTLLRLP